MAKAYIQYAWEARGGHSASRVKDEAWEKFFSRLDEADRLLRQAIALDVKDAEPYANLIVIGMGRGSPRAELDALLKEGMRIDPTYNSMYGDMATALLPRWGGKPGDVANLGKQVLDQVPGDNGLDIYSNIALVASERDPHVLFWGGFDHPTLVRAAEIAVNRYPRRTDLPPFAALCTMAANDQTAARRVRPLLKDGEAPGPALWKAVRQRYLNWCDSDVPEDEMRVWGAHYGPLSFDSNGDLWFGAASDSSSVVILDGKTHKPRQTFVGPPKGLTQIAIDHSRKWVVGAFNSASFKGWVLWQTNKPDQPLAYSTSDPCRAVAIDPSAPRLAWAIGQNVEIQNLTSKNDKKTLKLQSPPGYVMFSEDGTKLVILGPKISVWDLNTAEKQFDLPQVTDVPTPSLFCEDFLGIDSQNRIMTIGCLLKSAPNLRRPLVRFTADGKEWETILENVTPDAILQPYAGVLGNQGRLLAFAEPGTEPNTCQGIQVWNIETGKRLKRFPISGPHFRWLSISPDGRKLASGDGFLIQTWSISD